MIWKKILLTLLNFMSKYTIFVCKSCHRSSEEGPKNPPFDGDILLKRSHLLAAGFETIYPISFIHLHSLTPLAVLRKFPN
jgi:predicted metal-binding protein